MPPSLARSDYNAAPSQLADDAGRGGDRLPLGNAWAVILGLSIAAWLVTIQGARMIAALVG